MILGYSTYDSTPYDDVYCGNNIKGIELKNVIIDELKIDNKIVEPTVTKQDWSYSTVFDAKFNGNLDAGDIDNKGIPIKDLRLKRRKKGKLKWDIIKEYEYDKNVTDYDYIDKYVKDGETYEYSLVPVTATIYLVLRKYSPSSSSEIIFFERW